MFKKLLFMIALLLALPIPVLAVSVPGTGGNIFFIPNLSGFTNVSQIIDRVVQLVFFASGVALFFNFLIGGFQWINAGGDAKAMAAARTRMTNSAIGLVIVVAAFSITAIISQVFGISILGGFRFF